MQFSGIHLPGQVDVNDDTNLITQIVKQKLIQINSRGLFHCLAIILVCLVTMIVYSPGLSGPLVLDDIPNLYHLFRFSEGAVSWLDAVHLVPNGTGRPVAILSFMANLLISPDNVWALKFTNLLIHVSCGLLIYRLSRLLLDIDIHDEKHSHYVALGIMALWLLSPFLLSTVLYVIQRMAQLETLFVLAGLVLYTNGRINLEQNKTPGISLIVTCFLVMWPLATLSKQNGILLPLLVLAIEFFFFYRKDNYAGSGKLRTWLVLLTCIPLLLFCIAVYLSEYSLLDYSGREFSLVERLLTEPRILLDYIANLLIIPGASPMSLFHDDYAKSTGLLSPITTLPSLLIPVMVMVLAFITRKSSAGKILFGLVFFYAAQIVESTIIPLELYFEHRNYLPAFGIYFSVVYGIYFLLKKINFHTLAIVTLLIYPLTFSILTYQRATIWQKRSSIYFLSELTHPDSPRVNEGLAYYYLQMHKPEDSLRYLDKVLSAHPRYRPPGFYFKYLLAHCQGHIPMQERDYKILSGINSLTDKLSTVNYLRMFVASVESGDCDSLDLPRISDQLDGFAGNATDPEGNANVKALLARLRVYINRNSSHLQTY